MKGQCKDCYWWENNIGETETEDDDDTMENDFFGYCHRNAPLVTNTESHSDLSPEAVWTITKPNNWCGEFKLNEECQQQIDVEDAIHKSMQQELDGLYD